MGDSTSAFNEVLAKKSAALEKAFDAMSLICAGSFAVIVSLRTEKPTIYVSVALITMVVNVFSTLIWHLSTWVSFHRLAKKFAQDPLGTHSGDITSMGVFALILAITSFLVTFVALLFSVHS